MDLLVIAAAGLVIWASRAMLVGPGGGVGLPGPAGRLLAHARPASLGALAGASLAAPGGGGTQLTWALGAVAAGAAAYRTRSPVAAVAAGVLAVWLAAGAARAVPAW